MRTGVRVGIDVGTVRIGISRSDRDGLLATPYETVNRAEDSSDYVQIAALIEEASAREIIVGLPLSLSGAPTASTNDAIAFAEQLSSVVSVPIRMVDERLSTVSAARALHVNGKSTRKSRSIIDQTAATVILQHALDSERLTGAEPGTQLPAIRES